MEKIIYLLWKPTAADAASWGRQLREALPSALRDAGVHAARLNLDDGDVAAAGALRQRLLPDQPQALLQVWVDSAIASLRAPVDAVVTAQAARWAGYLVTESQPLRNTRHPARVGQRTEGFAQMALLRRPLRLSSEAWLMHWHTVQTPVAIETQDTFEYVQNLVVRALNADAPLFDAIVEECFPADAMTDPQAFFDARGDEQKFQRNLQRMMDSVGGFLDLPIDCIPTSQYPLL
jgi:hypothetical protein